MQKLIFESAWDKTIAPADRKHIENTFKEQAAYIKEGVHFSFLREAINHKNEILVIVLIHNGTEADLTIEDTVISYEVQGKEKARGFFDVPCIPRRKSMPWTFIFSPTDHIKSEPFYTITKN